jgi:hypothetical protein
MPRSRTAIAFALPDVQLTVLGAAEAFCSHFRNQAVVTPGDPSRSSMRNQIDPVSGGVEMADSPGKGFRSDNFEEIPFRRTLASQLLELPVRDQLDKGIDLCFVSVWKLLSNTRTFS